MLSPRLYGFCFLEFLRSYGKVVLTMCEAFYPAMAALAGGGGTRVGRETGLTHTNSNNSKVEGHLSLTRCGD